MLLVCCVCFRSPGSGRGAAAEWGGPQRQKTRWVHSSDVGSSRRFVFCRCGVCVCVFSQCDKVLHKGEGMWSRADGAVCIHIYAVVAGVRVGSIGLSGCWSLVGRGALCVWELWVFVVVCAGGGCWLLQQRLGVVLIVCCCRVCFFASCMCAWLLTWLVG